MASKASANEPAPLAPTSMAWQQDQPLMFLEEALPHMKVVTSFSI